MFTKCFHPHGLTGPPVREHNVISTLRTEDGTQLGAQDCPTPILEGSLHPQRFRNQGACLKEHLNWFQVATLVPAARVGDSYILGAMLRAFSPGLLTLFAYDNSDLCMINFHSGDRRSQI